MRLVIQVIQKRIQKVEQLEAVIEQIEAMELPVAEMNTILGPLKQKQIAIEALISK